MREMGVEWVFIGGVDNCLVKMVDPVLMGVAIDKQVTVACKSVVKANPKEKVGVFCKKNGKPNVIEYTEITEEMADSTDENGELLYGESHILCNLFSVGAIERMGANPLPYHVAYKKAKYIDKNGEIQDDYRIEFFKEHLQYLHKGIEEGSNCFGYHSWTPIDCWSWSNAYKNRYGFIAVDLATQKKTIKKSGRWIKEVAENNGF